jgi:DNA modification methylase
MFNQLHLGDNLTIIKSLPDDVIDLTITSPPYDDIRTYESKVGKLNNNFNDYSFNFEPLAKELYRITKPGGVIVWVVGDAVIKGSETGSSFRQALYFMECGFNLHDTMIYEKNGTSFPARRDGNRYSQIFEYMFILSKGVPKTTNLICDKENRWAGFTSFGTCKKRNKNGELIARKMKPVPTHSARNNIWKFNTGKNYSTKDAIAFDHPAIFPEKLVVDHILTWSNEGDMVFDPFLGSGTTVKMAKLNNRQYLGIEMVEKYYKIAVERLKSTEIPEEIEAEDIFI